MKKANFYPENKQQNLKNVHFHTLNFYFFSSFQQENRNLVGELYFFHILAKKNMEKAKLYPENKQQNLKSVYFHTKFLFF